MLPRQLPELRELAVVPALRLGATPTPAPKHAAAKACSMGEAVRGACSEISKCSESCWASQVVAAVHAMSGDTAHHDTAIKEY